MQGVMENEKARLLEIDAVRDVTFESKAVGGKEARKGVTKRGFCLAALVSLCVLVGVFGGVGGMCSGRHRSRPVADIYGGSTEHPGHLISDLEPLKPKHHEKRAGLPVGKDGLVKRQSASTNTTSAVLVDFQVHQPVLTPEGATLDSGKSNGEAGDVTDSCEVLLMDYVFAYSYGEPYIGKTPSPSPLPADVF